MYCNVDHLIINLPFGDVLNSTHKNGVVKDCLLLGCPHQSPFLGMFTSTCWMMTASPRQRNWTKWRRPWLTRDNARAVVPGRWCVAVKSHKCGEHRRILCLGIIFLGPRETIGFHIFLLVYPTLAEKPTNCNEHGFICFMFLWHYALQVYAHTSQCGPVPTWFRWLGFVEIGKSCSLWSHPRRSSYFNGQIYQGIFQSGSLQHGLLENPPARSS